MTNFDDTIKDKKIYGHPIFDGHRKWAQEDWKSPDELTDFFSDMNTPYNKKKSRDLRSMVAEAAMVVQDQFAQFDIPMQPNIRFVHNRDTKYAKYDPNQIVSGKLEFEAEFLTLTGVKKKALIPVTVQDGEITPPSVMEVNGRLGIISAHEINEMLDRVTSYKLPQLRHTFEPPLTRDQRELAVETRNDTGWLPSTAQHRNYMQRKNNSKQGYETRDKIYGDLGDVPKVLDISENLDTLEELISSKIESYDVSIEDWSEVDYNSAVASTDDPSIEVHVASDNREITVKLMDVQYEYVIDQFTISADSLGDLTDNTNYEELSRIHSIAKRIAGRFGKSAVRTVALKIAQDYQSDELDEMMGYLKDLEEGRITEEEYIALLEGNYFQQPDEQIEYLKPSVGPSTMAPQKMSKKQASKPVPTAYKNVVEMMEEAEEDGTDTFPRSWDYLLRKYILEVVSVASKDAWIIPLINDGFCLNPHGPTIRTRRKAASFKVLDRIKRAQEIEKEIDLQVTDKPFETDEINKDQRFYTDTKTPVEVSDEVKLGKFTGTIVEVSGDSVVVKSRGNEIKASISALEPMPSTFEKMY